MSGTQDTLIERLNRGRLAYMSDSGPVYAGPTSIEREAATALADRDAKIAELERDVMDLVLDRGEEQCARLAAEAQVAELTQKLERATVAVEFVARWAWRTDPPNGNRKMSDGERLSCIKHHPVIKKAAAPHIELAEQEARALNSGASQNG